MSKVRATVGPIAYRNDIESFKMKDPFYEVLNLNVQLDETPDGEPLKTGTFCITEDDAKDAIKELDANPYYRKEHYNKNVDDSIQLLKSFLKIMKKNKEKVLYFHAE